MAIRVTQKDFLFRAIVLAVLIVLVVAFGQQQTSAGYETGQGWATSGDS